MNILPKKNWHVRNKDNIAKVKRDEAKAAEEEKQRQKRLQIAESEARLDELRSKTNKTRPIEFVSSQEHVNLFEREERGQFNEEKNRETELEKKNEKEEFEKKIGLLTYLNTDKIDFKSQPWNQTVRDNNSNSNKEIDLKRKLQVDPLSLMRAYTDDKSKKPKTVDISKDKNIKKLKSADTSVKNAKKTIEQLRTERLQRENDERQRVNQLFNPTKATVTVELDDRKRRYNSQFNPSSSRY